MSAGILSWRGLHPFRQTDRTFGLERCAPV